MSRRSVLRAASLAGGAALLLSACGPPAVRKGSVPFPARSPVLADPSGTAVRDLPPPDTDARLVVLDPPWCTPCEGAWEAVGVAVGSFPPGTVKVYRLLLDRERLLTPQSPSREVPPLLPPGGTGAVEVVTYHVLPGEFRASFEVERAPVFLLLDRKGKVRERWAGFHPSLADELAAGIRALAAPELKPVPAPPVTPAPGR